MLKPVRGILLVVALAGVAACASRGADGANRSVTSRQLLTKEQLEATYATNAYDAVQRLRSQWLQLRGSTQMPTQPGGMQTQQNPVLVYLDGQRMGTVDHLRAIEIAAVEYIRYFPPAEASARWGFNHGGGVIFVSTRPGGEQP